MPKGESGPKVQVVDEPTPAPAVRINPTREGFEVVTFGQMRVAGPFAAREEAEQFLRNFEEACEQLAAELVTPAPAIPRSRQVS